MLKLKKLSVWCLLVLGMVFGFSSCAIKDAGLAHKSSEETWLGSWKHFRETSNGHDRIAVELQAQPVSAKYHCKCLDDSSGSSSFCNRAFQKGDQVLEFNPLQDLVFRPQYVSIYDDRCDPYSYDNRSGGSSSEATNGESESREMISFSYQLRFCNLASEDDYTRFEPFLPRAFQYPQKFQPYAEFSDSSMMVKVNLECMLKPSR